MRGVVVPLQQSTGTTACTCGVVMCVWGYNYVMCVYDVDDDDDVIDVIDVMMTGSRHLCCSHSGVVARERGGKGGRGRERRT